MLVALGQAYELRYVATLDGSENVVRFPSAYWWAWMGQPATGTLRLVKILGRAQRPRAAERTHAGRTYARFHGDDPDVFFAVEDADERAPAPTRGYATAVAYDARGFSTFKSDLIRRHYFGDYGEGITAWDRANARYCPSLCVTASGHLFLRRRASNSFSLGEWIEG